MDHYSRQALKLLGESVKASGEIITTVAGWTNPHAQHARREHLRGAVENVQRVSAVAGVLAEA